MSAAIEPSGIGAVILAAGSSTRFGSPKQLLEIDGQALLQRAIEAAIQAGLKPVVVVLGANAMMIAPSLAESDAVSVVVNHDWENGQASSLAVGITAANNDRLRGVIVMLADQPGVDANSLERLVGAFDNEHRVIAAAYSDTVGAPVLFGMEYLPALTTLSGDHGAGGWLRAHPDAVTAIEMAEAALDIDTPADFFLHSPRHGNKGNST
ncbi:MAG: nucleotidyltransferase family protein [Gemmatimonadaceae bacterium]